MKTIDTLIDDIYNLFNGHTVDPKLNEAFGKELSGIIADRLSANLKPRKFRLRMSNIGKPCTRAMWYENKEYEQEAMQPYTYIKFLIGDIAESVLLYLAKEAGHEVTHEQHEIEVDGIKGHTDAVIDGVLVDVKTASPFAFKKFSEGTIEEDDPFGYLTQLNGYSNALNIKRKGFLAMEKSLGKLTFYEPKPRDDDISSLIAKVKQDVDGDTVPDRPFGSVEDGKSGNRKLPVTCSYCNFKYHCWDGLRTFIYSTGPRFLTTVKKVPNVPEVTNES